MVMGRDARLKIESSYTLFYKNNLWKIKNKLSKVETEALL